MNDFAIPIISALTGMLVTSAISWISMREVVKRSVRDLDAALKIISEISIKLAAIQVKIDDLGELREVVLDHEKQLFAMREKSGRLPRHNPSNRNSFD